MTTTWLSWADQDWTQPHPWATVPCRQCGETELAANRAIGDVHQFVCMNCGWQGRLDPESTTPKPPEAIERIASYAVSAVPDGMNELDASLFTNMVEHAGFDRWAIRWMGRCLNAALEWSHEPIPSSRADDWLNEHRFERSRALKLAKLAAPHLEVNGRKAATQSGTALCRHVVSGSHPALTPAPCHLPLNDDGYCQWGHWAGDE